MEKCKDKVLLILNEAPRHGGRLEEYFHTFFTSELDGGEWSATCSTPGVTYSAEVGAPQTRRGRCADKKNLLLFPGIEY